MKIEHSIIAVVLFITAAMAVAAVNYTCGARSLIGRFYYVSGPDQGIAQAQAIANCQQHSLDCYATGCQVQP
jgi:hypothetical protein